MHTRSRVGNGIGITGIPKFTGELIFDGNFARNEMEVSSLAIAEGAEVPFRYIPVNDLTGSWLVEGEAKVSQWCHVKEMGHLQCSLMTFRLAKEGDAIFAGASELFKPAYHQA